MPVRIAVAVVVCAFSLTAAPLAQSIRRETIQNETIGWMRIYDKPLGPVTIDHRSYTVPQMAVSQLFREWIQRTYVPVGGQGDVVVSLSERLGPYNQYLASLPQSYGGLARIYTDLKPGAKQKYERASNSHIVWSVLANGYVGETALGLSTAERIYFTMPPMALQIFGGETADKQLDLSRHPVLGRFPSYVQRNSVNGNRKHILITKDRQLPYVALTKGEYLVAMEAAVGRRYAEEKAKLDADHNRKFAEAVMPRLEATHQKRLEVLAANKERYKSRLQEPAQISTIAPDALLENVPDVFEGNGGSKTRLQVYTIDPAMAERAKGDRPVWILVSWTAELHDPVIKHLHDAVVGKFNFDYVYNYFFEPEKVKGQAYTPLK